MSIVFVLQYLRYAMTNVTKIETMPSIDKPQTMNATDVITSTSLVLGHDGDWWDIWMLGSLIVVGLAALAAAAFTTGSVLVHKREAAAASAALDRYKLDTAGKVAEATTAGISAGEKAGAASLEAARANVRAAEAALALAKYKAPRDLSPVQQERLIAVLKPFAGQNFACAVFPDPESVALTRLLDTLAKSSGWKRVPSQIQRDGGVLTEVNGESAATIFDSGVTAYIAPDDQESVPAQKAFCSTLMADGIHCETHRTPQLAGRTPRAITIAVGKKP
jgi:hypothetical protein